MLGSNDTMTTSSILITGGCGFIGTALIAGLLESNTRFDIRVLDNFANGSAEDLAAVTAYEKVLPDRCANPGVVLVEGDIRDAANGNGQHHLFLSLEDDSLRGDFD